MTDPTPEAIAQAVARVTADISYHETATSQASAATRTYIEMERDYEVQFMARSAATHANTADALRLLLTLAAAHVPVEDRERCVVWIERGADAALSDGHTRHAEDLAAEARRLLKLPAREGA